jgi:hypothetical protein
LSEPNAPCGKKRRRRHADGSEGDQYATVKRAWVKDSFSRVSMTAAA